MTGAQRARLAERLRPETLVPLLAAYFILTTLYVWQAWRRESPTIFTDELELTQISRSIAETGRSARRGEPYGLSTLVPWLTTPGWWIRDVSTAYETIKYVQALVMAAALFPAYLIARTVVSRPWAVFAAVATIAAPALSYAPILVEEPWAYPASSLALWLILRATKAPTWRRAGIALAGCLLAVACRSQLVALVATLAISLAVVAWRSRRASAWRASWARWDWVGAITLLVGFLLFFSAFMSHRSQEWEITTRLYKGRIFDFGVWAGGAFSIGVGIVPVVAVLAVLVRPRTRRGPAVSAFVIVTAAALVSFGWYAAIKGAYLSTVFSNLIVERNLVYLGPLVFAATALALERRDLRWWVAAPAGALVLYLVTATPTIRGIDQYPYYEAHGLSILALANRLWSWPAGRIETALVVVALVGTAALVLLRPLQSRSFGGALAVAVAALVLTWNLTNEIYAANGEHTASKRLLDSFAASVDSPSWIDDATGTGSVVIVGQQFLDNNGLWLTEFWNRNVHRVWSVDPTSPAPGPGPTLTPDLERADGTLGSRPGTDYALGFNGVTLQAPVVARRGTSVLYRLDGGVLKLAYNQSGVDSDGWATDKGSGARAAYNRFDGGGSRFGFAKVQLQQSFCTRKAPDVTATIRIGPLRSGSDRQPALGRTTSLRRVRIEPCGSRTVLLRPPRGAWRIEVAISPTFSPAQIDPKNYGSERRQLGARVGFDYVALG